MNPFDTPSLTALAALGAVAALMGGVRKSRSGAGFCRLKLDTKRRRTRPETGAPDFTYDKTGLPRYLDQNKAVFSALSYDVPGRTDTYGSGSGIVTNSAFDDVVAWYRKSLPAGWSNSSIGDLNRLGAVAQALSPDKIMQMMSASSDAAPAKSVGDIPETATADRTRLAMFSPPAGTKRDLGVMIVQRGDRPVVVMMKSHISP